MKNDYFVRRDLVLEEEKKLEEIKEKVKPKEKKREQKNPEAVVITDSFLLEETMEEKAEREEKSWIRAKKIKCSEFHPDYYLG